MDSKDISLNIMRMIKRFLNKLMDVFLSLFQPIASPVFSINTISATFRTWLFVIAVLAWVIFAYLISPPDTSIVPESFGDPFQNPFAYMFSTMTRMFYFMIAYGKPLFVPQVFRHILAISTALWMTFRLAAIYLDDIFEIGDTKVSEKFIRQAAFITIDPRSMNRLIISNGKVPSHARNSPIYQIGGPGLVITQLENVAVFEKVDGETHIVGPRSGRVQLEGFERLRKIIDLRNIVVDNLEVEGRTRDGIPIKATGIQIEFSIKRDGTTPVPRPASGKPMPQPLTFTEQAVKNIVYNESNQDFHRIATNKIKSAIRRFMSQTTLNEFLVNASEATAPPVGPGATTIPLPPDKQAFIPRRELVDQFYASVDIGDRSIMDLHWFNLGIWETPEIVPKKHREAWLQSLNNSVQTGSKALTKLYRETRIAEALRLIQDVPINAFTMLRSRDPDREDRVKRELMLAYRERLKNAYDQFKNDNEQPPDELVITLKYLERL